MSETEKNGQSKLTVRSFILIFKITVFYLKAK